MIPDAKKYLIGVLILVLLNSTSGNIQRVTTDRLLMWLGEVPKRTFSTKKTHILTTIFFINSHIWRYHHRRALADLDKPQRQRAAAASAVELARVAVDGAAPPAAAAAAMAAAPAAPPAAAAAELRRGGRQRAKFTQPRHGDRNDEDCQQKQIAAGKRGGRGGQGRKEGERPRGPGEKEGQLGGGGGGGGGGWAWASVSLMTHKN